MPVSVSSSVTPTVEYSSGLQASSSKGKRILTCFRAGPKLPYSRSLNPMSGLWSSLNSAELGRSFLGMAPSSAARPCPRRPSMSISRERPSNTENPVSRSRCGSVCCSSVSLCVSRLTPSTRRLRAFALWPRTPPSTALMMGSSFSSSTRTIRPYRSYRQSSAASAAALSSAARAAAAPASPLAASRHLSSASASSRFCRQGPTDSSPPGKMILARNGVARGRHPGGTTSAASLGGLAAQMLVAPSRCSCAAQSCCSFASSASLSADAFINGAPKLARIVHVVPARR
mmetsp:Transcript_70504/g.199985  ORF Transcript_70504/g.199985 Transcript_70504/m.199985 type:complete len:287 (-) Transcript_70504:1108-1968(-)